MTEGIVVVSPTIIRTVGISNAREEGRQREKRAAILRALAAELTKQGVKPEDLLSEKKFARKIGAERAEEARDKMKMLAWLPGYAHAGERLAIIRALLAEGYDVRVPRPTHPRLEPLYRPFIDRAITLGAKLVDTPEANSTTLAWARDQYLQVKGTVLLSARTTHDYTQAFDAQGERATCIAGEGGRVVLGKGFALASSLDEDSKARLRRRGYKVLQIPAPKSSLYVEERPGRPVKPEPISYDDHVDKHIGIVNRRSIMLVDPAYYNENRSRLREIARQRQHKIVVIPQEEARLQPANFAELPDGRILLNKAPKTIKALREAGLKPEDYIVAPQTVRFNPYYFGGIRCFTNSFVLTGNKPSNRARA